MGSWGRNAVDRIGTYGTVAFLAVLLVAVVACLRFYLVPTDSMAPLVEPGSRIAALALPYGITHEFARGDVAVFRSPASVAGGVAAGEVLVKRVVAVAGDTVRVADGVLYVNGEPSPWQGSSANVGSFACTVPAGRYFLMGDNRARSLDSRYFGTVPAGNMLGRAFGVYLPYLRSLW